MKQWEYNETKLSKEVTLKKMGDNGWELSGINGDIHTFKRPKRVYTMDESGNEYELDAETGEWLA